MLFSEYEQCVILTYRKEKSKGTLSLNLSEPTAASLRNECLIVLSSRPLKKDEKTLRLFFNYNKESNDYSDAIENYDPDGLKPLANLLKGKTSRTDKKNIELLAWLIDFKERPYIFGSGQTCVIKMDDEQENSYSPNKVKSKTELPTTSPKEENIGEKKITHNWTEGFWREKTARRKITTSITIFGLLIGGSYLYIDQNKAYICEQGVGKRYHLNPNCPALKNCANGVVQTTIAAAEKNGKTRCRFEP